MHPLSVDIGIPWTSQFFTGKTGWQKPENIIASIDQFLAATIAYGHIGWLVEETHGIRQACRSYYMLQPLQSRYAMLKPQEILYGTDKGLVSSSAALQGGEWRKSKLFIRYPGGLRIWINGNASESWQVEHEKQVHNLPSFGWLAIGADGFIESSESIDGKRFDRASSPACIFIDGRGTWREFDGIGTSGSVAVTRPDSGDGLSVVTVEGVDRVAISRPEGPFAADDVRTAIARVAQAPGVVVRAFDVSGKDLGGVTARRTQIGWEIDPPKGAVRLGISAAQR